MFRWIVKILFKTISFSLFVVNISAIFSVDVSIYYRNVVLCELMRYQKRWEIIQRKQEMIALESILSYVMAHSLQCNGC